MDQASLKYWDFSNQKKETVFSYFLFRLLHENGLWDEQYKEVYIYITGLLIQRIQPEHLLASDKYLIKYETDLMERLDASNDLASQYYCLKFNADHLLVDAGIFLNEDEKVVEKIDRGKTYYRLTANCAQHIYRKQNCMIQIFEHLSDCFGDYQKKLKQLRKVYFQFINRLNNEEKEELFSQVNQLIQLH